MMKIFIVFISLIAIGFYFLRDQDNPTKTTASEPGTDKLQTIATLPKAIKESSGIEVISDKGHYLTHNDANNKPNLYELDAEGKLVETHTLKLPNVDWEDLARDTEGNLYIADIGNNDNDREELAIYKVSMNDLQNPQPIRFKYEDNYGKKSGKSFDCEAIFWHDGNLYLITKERKSKTEATVYQLSDEPGNQTAKIIGTLNVKAPVTGASISPDGNMVALLSEGKVHMFKDIDSPEKFFEQEHETIMLPGAGQTEAITFEDNNTLILTSEGSTLYKYKL